MDLNSPKQMELCFTLEEKQAATHTHLVQAPPSSQMKSEPRLSFYECHRQPSKRRAGASLGSPASGRLQDHADGIRNKKHVSPYHLEAGLI